MARGEEARASAARTPAAPDGPAPPRTLAFHFHAYASPPRQVPWKFLLTLALVAACSAQIIMYQMDVIPYVRGSIESWQLLLQPPGVSLNSVQPFGYANVFYIYRLSTLLGSMQKTRDTYFDVGNITVDMFRYVGGGGAVTPLELELTSFAEGEAVFDLDDDFSDRTVTSRYELREGSGLGPFSEAAHNGTLDALVHTMYSARLSFRLQNYKFAGRRTCYEWRVAVEYDFSVRGRITMVIDAEPGWCPEERDLSWHERSSSGFIALFFVIGVLSAALLALHLRAVWRAVTIYQGVKLRMARRSGEAPSQMFGQLSCRDRMRFFNLWFIYALIGNVSNIAGSVVALQSLITVSSPSVAYTYFMGFGALFTWVCILQFFETTTSYYVLITTLAKGTPRVARFLVGVLPVFLGYAMFGVAFFGTETVRFSTVDQACVTLFALLNGDVIHDVFDEIHPAHPYISRVYLYTFISLFIYAVLNIFIAIIEDAFFASKAFQLQQQKESRTLDLEQLEPLDLVDRLWAPAEGEGASEPPAGAGRGGADAAGGRAGAGLGGGARAAAYEFHASQAGLSSPAPMYQPPRASSGRATGSPGLSQPLLSSSPQAARYPSPSSPAPAAPLLLVRQSSSVSAAPTTASGSAVDPSVREVVDHLSAISESFSAEVTRHLVELLSGGGGAGGEAAAALAVRASDVRPPHDLGYFPCGFDDCLYCAVRSVYAEVLEQAREELHQAVAECLGHAPADESDEAAAGGALGESV